MNLMCRLLASAAFLLVLNGSALSIPNCSQITSSWCSTYCSGPGWVEFTDCDPEQALWRCRCNNPIPPSSWGSCWCEGYEQQGCDCLLAGTALSMADGTTKPIETVEVGDRVLAWDERTSRAVVSEVVASHAPYEVSHYYVINGRLRITEHHPILTVDGEWVPVARLKNGDSVQGPSGEAIAITELERIDAAATAYNIQVKTGTYVVHGIVVHNKEDCEEHMPGPYWP